MKESYNKNMAKRAAKVVLYKCSPAAEHQWMCKRQKFNPSLLKAKRLKDETDEV